VVWFWSWCWGCVCGLCGLGLVGGVCSWFVEDGFLVVLWLGGFGLWGFLVRGVVGVGFEWVVCLAVSFVLYLGYGMFVVGWFGCIVMGVLGVVGLLMGCGVWVGGLVWWWGGWVVGLVGMWGWCVVWGGGFLVVWGFFG